LGRGLLQRADRLADEECAAEDEPKPTHAARKGVKHV
jgi:hypothetical protein